MFGGESSEEEMEQQFTQAKWTIYSGLTICVGLWFAPFAVDLVSDMM